MISARLVRRCFSADAGLAGRYASALFSAAKEKKRIDQVYNDLAAFRDLLTTDASFKLFTESPGIQKDQRASALDDICKKLGADELTSNLLKLLIDNKRFPELKKVVEAFEVIYREEKGQIVCNVQSAAPLSPADQTRVKSALQSRAKKGAELIVSFEVTPSVLGGLLVKMGDAVFDFSVSSKVDRLQAQLLMPLTQ